MHLCAGFMRHLALEALWIEHCRCALFIVVYELHFESIIRIREVLFILFPDTVLSFIPDWLSYLTWYNLFFFFPRQKHRVAMICIGFQIPLAW